jgi:hypothetical protein
MQHNEKKDLVIKAKIKTLISKLSDDWTKY